MSGRGFVRCLVAAVLFGASAPAAAQLAGTIPSFTLAGLLYLGAAIAVSPWVVGSPPSRSAVRLEWRPALVAVVAGGAVGPVLLMAGLARTDAATASIVLNAEMAATFVFAAVLFREHLGGRLVVGAVLVTLASAMLAWQPGGAIDTGALFIVAACVAWGLDNGVTARIENLGPEHVVALKGLVAGGANVAIGLSTEGIGDTTRWTGIVAALAIGAVGYGASITLWVKGARDLGAARGQLIFSTAPFIGVGVAWFVMGEPVRNVQLVAVAVAAAGVALSLRSAHEHRHRHDALVHDHEHTHDDDHHDHDHRHEVCDRAVRARHRHVHEHRARVHSHPHVPDLHHRHEH